jgi:hypothetical protein
MASLYDNAFIQPGLKVGTSFRKLRVVRLQQISTKHTSVFLRLCVGNQQWGLEGSAYVLSLSPCPPPLPPSVLQGSGSGVQAAMTRMQTKDVRTLFVIVAS